MAINLDHVTEQITVTDTATNASLTVQPKGTGAFNIAAGSSGLNLSNGGTVTGITRTALGGYTSVPSVALSAPTTAGSVQATATCSVQTTSATIAGGGTGYTVNDTITMVGGTPVSSAGTFRVATVSGGVITSVDTPNFAAYTAVPTNPVSVTGGTGSGATLNVNYFVGSFTITNAGSGYVEQPTVTFSGGGGSGAAAYASVGSAVTVKSVGESSGYFMGFRGPNNLSDTLRLGVGNALSNEHLLIENTQYGRSNIIALGSANSQIWMAAAGAGYVNFSTNGTSLVSQMRVTHTSSAVNVIQATGAATGSGPTISAQGSDTNADLNVTAKGTGNIRLNTGSGEQVRVINSGGTPTNYVALKGGAGGVTVYADGTGSAEMTLGSLGGYNLKLTTNGATNEQLRIINTNSSVNFIQMTGSATGGATFISSAGSDTNIPLSIASKGTGILYLGGGSTRISANSANALFLNAPSGAVNYVAINGSATGISPAYLARGGDANVGLTFGTYNDANIDFYASGDPNAGTGRLQFRVAPTSTAVNYVQVTGATTGNSPNISAQGSDSNIQIQLQAKGTGLVRFATGGGLQAYVSDTASSVNYVQMTGAATGGAPAISAQGSDTDITLFYQTKGVGSHVFGTRGTTQQFRVSDTGSAVNYLQVNGAVTGSGPTLRFNGSDTNIDGIYAVRGAGAHRFFTNDNNQQQFQIAHTASAVNYIQVSGAATGGAPYLLANGSDADVSLIVTSKGAGAIFFKTAGAAPTQLAVTHTASAQNYVNITGATLSNGPIISAQGAAGSIDLKLASKGYGGLLFYANETDLQFSIGLTFSPVNFFRVTGSTAGVGLVLTAQGSDTNIPVAIQPKGTGALQAQLTDSTATGGNARGANAIDFQTSRNAASQVASGSNSVVAGGSRNTASGSLTSVVGGFSNSATGYAATIVGGISHTAAGYYNFIGGGVANSGTSSTAVTSQNGTLASGSQFVTLTGSNASIKVGQYIVGAAIDTDTYVYGVGGTSLILSKPALAAGNVVLSFFTPHGVVVGGGNNTATGSYSFIGGGGDAGDSANKNVASGDWATISGGRTNTASNLYTVISGGSSNTASGQYSSVLGGGFNQALGFGSSVAGGYANYSNGTYSQVLSGQYGSARGIDANLVMSSNAPFGGSLGVSQAAILVLGAQTVDATATVLCTNTAAAGATNQVSLPNNSAYFFTGEIVAGVTGGGNTKGWTIQGVIKRGANAASTALVGTPTVTSSYADAGASTWTIAVTADTGYGGIKVTFTGQASTTIRTVAQIRTTEMTY